MSTEDDTRARALRGRPLLGLLLSVLLHTLVFAPVVIVALILGAREEAERLARQAEDDEGVDMEWRDVRPEDLPENLPPLQARPAEARPVRPEPKPRVPDPTLPEKPTNTPEPKPQPPPTETQPEQKPPPPEVRKQHEKIVDLDLEQNVEPPKDAKYLAQKNNRVENETRATETNLERAQKGETRTQLPSQSQAPEPGADKARVARIEEVASQLGRRAPDMQPSATPAPVQASPAERPRARSMLAMRQLEPRPHTVTPETANPSLPPGGELSRRLPDENLRSLSGLPPVPASPGGAESPRLRLRDQDLEYLFGKEADAARRLAESQRSTQEGRFTRYLEQGRSALENFIPEVRPGNQTLLNTRAAPFAAFMARMHRDIHELWAFGFLNDLDGRSGRHALNDRDLWTRLEIVLRHDGTIDNVKVIRSSGQVTFDLAAVDVVHSAGPYPEPPSALRSKNGKIYLHWAFHRDERACGTMGVDYFVLDNAPADSDLGTGSDTAREESARTSGARAASEDGARRLARLGTERGHATVPHSDARHGHEAEADPAAERLARASRVDPKDPAARDTAERFFTALAGGDSNAMLARAALPFRNESGVTARNASELGAQFKGLVEELGRHHKAPSIHMHSPAGLRAATGWLPERFADEARILFATATLGGESYVAVLSPAGNAWKVTGLIHR